MYVSRARLTARAVIVDAQTSSIKADAGVRSVIRPRRPTRSSPCRQIDCSAENTSRNPVKIPRSSGDQNTNQIRERDEAAKFTWEYPHVKHTSLQSASLARLLSSKTANLARSSDDKDEFRALPVCDKAAMAT